jgi:2-polyprenyl-6-methoxyphenol hydroxylase-like FAD-dependent oxidoreductase
VIEVVIVGAGPNGLMLACELGLAGIQPVVLDPMPGPSPQARANRIVGQAARILDHRGLYSVLAGTAEPPKTVPDYTFAGFPLNLASVPGSQLFTVPIQQRGLVEVLAERAGEYHADLRWGHDLIGFDQHDDGVTVHAEGPDGTYDLTAKYFVGADGGTSKVRHLAGIDEPPMSLADLEASAKRVLGTDVPLRPVSPDAPLDLRRFSGINSRIASRYQVGRVFLVGEPRTSIRRLADPVSISVCRTG